MPAIDPASYASHVIVYPTDEVALPIHDGIDFISNIMKSGTAVLGGDIYIMTPAGLRPARDNWYVDKKPAENRGDYVRRSCEESTRYLQCYPNQSAYVVVVYE